MRFRGLLVIISCAIALSAIAQEPYYNRPAAVQQEFSSYMENVQTSLQKNWIPPDFLETGHVRVLFRINSDGKVLSSRIVETSGNEVYDESALDAIKKSAPFDKFPETTYRESITINYSFDTTLVKTDKMRYYMELSDKSFFTDKRAALNYINLAISEVQGDDGSYFLYKRRGKIYEALGDHLSAREDFTKYEDLKHKVDIKRVHAIKHRAELEDSAFAYFYLAYAYEQIKDYENAIHAINKAIQRTELNQQYQRYRTELVRLQAI